MGAAETSFVTVPRKPQGFSSGQKGSSRRSETLEGIASSLVCLAGASPLRRGKKGACLPAGTRSPISRGWRFILSGVGLRADMPGRGPGFGAGRGERADVSAAAVPQDARTRSLRFTDPYVHPFPPFAGSVPKTQGSVQPAPCRHRLGGADPGFCRSVRDLHAVAMPFGVIRDGVGIFGDVSAESIQALADCIDALTGRKISAPRNRPGILISPQCWGGAKTGSSTTFRVFDHEGRPGSFRPVMESLRPGELVAERTRGGCRESVPVRFDRRRLPAASFGPSAAGFVHARTSAPGS